MSEIVDRLPAVVEIDAEIERLRTQERDLAARTAKARQKYHRDRTAWEQEAVTAELDGKTAKPPPPAPDSSARDLVMGRLRAEIEQAVTARRRLIVEHADEIRATADEQGTQVLADAAEPVERLTELVARLRGAAAAVDEIADARQALDPRQTTPTRRPPAVDLGALLHALETGDLSVVLDGRDPRQPKTLGLQRSNLHEPAPEPRTTPVRNAPEPGETVTVHQTNRGAEL